MHERDESDFLGSVKIPANALFGVHSARARENFPDTTRFPVEWYKAMGWVKQACYLTYQSFRKAALAKFSAENLPIQFLDEKILEKMIETSVELTGGAYFDQFIVPAFSGGAGTSINMNVNEIIANVTLTKLGFQPGEYTHVDPIESANVFQSTNDVVPTALKVALIHLLQELELEINSMRSEMERLENTYRNDLRMGFTQMQEAVPTAYGKLFSGYSEALSRDWWRVSKCFERLKLVNLGGGAIGTGLAVPRYVIMEVVTNLQKITGLPLARSENLPDATANLDAFVEVHAILKSHAVNLEKMVSDIRLLASDLVGTKEIEIPRRQAGSSIMPGKINPVIPEFVISAAHRIYSNDQMITSLCSMGCLELNAYLPAIGVALIESLKLLIAADQSMKKNLLQGLTVNTNVWTERLRMNPSITTALIPFIGYNNASLLAKEMKNGNLSIIEANRKIKRMDEQTLLNALKPENLLKLGYSLNES